MAKHRKKTTRTAKLRTEVLVGSIAIAIILNSVLALFIGLVLTAAVSLIAADERIQEILKEERALAEAGIALACNSRSSRVW